MRNSKVKIIKKYAVIALAVLFLTTGASYAASTWSEAQNEINNTGSTTFTGDVNNVTDSPLMINRPPVPAGPVTIDGGGHTFTATGTPGSTTNYFINNGPGVDTTITDSHFEGANAGSVDAPVSGGAVQNSGNLTITTTPGSSSNTSFTNNTTEGNGGAVANTGSGTLNIERVDFSDNHSTGSGAQRGWGGAVYSEGTSAAITDSSFSSNTAQNGGGAVFNYAGKMTINGTSFIGNETTNDNSNGGAVVNAAEMEINGSHFENNYSQGVGGAFANAFNSGAEITTTISDTSFINNHSDTGGGAIINTGSATNQVHTLTINGGTIFDGNYVANEAGTTASYAGGAIINETGTAGGADAVLNINGTENNKVTFTNNVAETGGAILNGGSATISNTIFRQNGAKTIATGDLKTTSGGAIYNKTDGVGSAQMNISNTLFDSNTATDKGGAIYNEDGKIVITDSTFVNNSAGATSALPNGGAIYGAASATQGSETTLRATSGHSTVIGNENSVANGTDSIVFAGVAGATSAENKIAVGNFEAAAGGKIDIYSAVSGNTDASSNHLTEVNFNKSSDGNTYKGDVNFKGDASLSNTVANIYDGKVSFAHDRSFDASNILNMYGGTLNLLNGEYGAYQLQAREFNLKGDAGIMLDVDLAGTFSPDGKPGMDGIYKDNFGSITNDGGNTLFVEAMKSLTEAKTDTVKIQFTDADALIEHVQLGNNAGVIEAPINKYKVEQITQPVGGGTAADGTGPGEYFQFTKMGNSDSVLAGPVAAQAAFLLMDNLYRQSFANMDMVTLMTPEQRMAWKMRNKYANAGYHTGVYAPNVIPEERDGFYVRPFTNFENVPLKGGPKVSNVSYGTLIGGDSDLVDLGHGWDGNFSFFGAYHGSHQAYNGVSIWQNGGALGFVGTAYKGNFWTGVTANAGASAAEAHHTFGSEQFPIFMTGAAWKSGYNWGLLNNKLIIQPSYMMSYTFVNVFDYNNAAGVKITQDPLNAIEIIPGIRIIGNLKNGWMPYLGVNMTWNIMDKTKFYANEVALSQLSVKPYVEYGVGLQKRYGDRFTGFGQAMLRNGGRNGIAFTLGFRWALGH